MQIEFIVPGLKAAQRKRRRAASGVQRVSPIVRFIVLAYQIEQAVRDGRARDYADVARQVGMTRARVSQLLRLLQLPAEIIETLLLSTATLNHRLTERRLRKILAYSDPTKQSQALEAIRVELEPASETNMRQA